MIDGAAARAWLWEHHELFRAAMLLCALGWAVMAWAWLRPDASTLRRSLLAAACQLWVGLLLDAGLVRLGAWSYRDMPLLALGVPLDLHLDWSLLWGLGLCWLSERWPGARPTRRARLALVAGAAVLTLGFDAAVARWMLFLDAVSWWWWMADLAFLLVMLELTLRVHHGVPRDEADSAAGEVRRCAGTSPRATPTEPAPARPTARRPDVEAGSAVVARRWSTLPPLGRAWLYATGFGAFFFVWLPAAALDGAAALGISAHTLRVPWLPEGLAFAGLMLGAWAVDEFARMGGGTPVPWDPPRRLVTSGPYAFLGNPMQVAGLLLGMAVLASRASWITAAYLLDVVVMVCGVFLVVEPRALEQRFGEAYGRWRAAVRPWRVRLAPEPRCGDRPVLLFDDACGLCRGWVSVLSTLDASGALAMWPQSSAPARALLPRAEHGRLGRTLLLVEPRAGGVALVSYRSRAVLRALAALPMPLACLGALAALPGVVPVCDLLYGVVARVRHRVGRGSAACAALPMRVSRPAPRRRHQVRSSA